MKFQFFPTGLLHTSPKLSQIHKLDLEIVSDSISIRQLNPQPISFFKPTTGWSKTNEPESHLDSIALQLNLLPNISRILCYSYKDYSLAKRLSKLIPNLTIDILVDPYDGLILSWPEDVDESLLLDFISNISTPYDLFIMRHYLEHFCSPQNILNVLHGLPVFQHCLLYVEVPDCSRFVFNKNPLFLWEQHRSYFTSTSLDNLITSCNYHIQYCAVLGSSIEPSICMIASNNSKFLPVIPLSFCSNLRSSVVPLDKTSSLNFLEYISSWRTFLENQFASSIIYGIGHNADRFVQITNAHDHIDNYVDANRCKSGYFLASAYSSIISDIPFLQSESFNIILGTHDRSSKVLASKLSLEYPKASIYSIFSSRPVQINC